MSFAENLQYLRRRDKITQEELADRLGVSRQSVSKWETGEAFPETEKIIALCDIFGISMDILMRGDAEKLSTAAETESSVAAPVAEGVHTEENARARARLRTIGGSVNGGIMLCAVVSYLCMGGILGLWHPGWLVFLLAISLCAFFDGVFCKEGNPEKPVSPLAARVLRGLAGMIMLLSVTCYLFIGLVYGIWHPSWVIFPCAAVLIFVFNGAANAVGGGQEDKEEREDD